MPDRSRRSEAVRQGPQILPHVAAEVTEGLINDVGGIRRCIHTDPVDEHPQPPELVLGFSSEVSAVSTISISGQIALKCGIPLPTSTVPMCSPGAAERTFRTSCMS